MHSATLWVVATPIGNLDDCSPRARRILGEVALVCAEDTRRTRKLMHYFGLQTRLLSLQEHNEAQRVPALLERLQRGEDIALVSDAGTPLISDPGYRLVRAARVAGVRVSPVPGPCALVAALSVSALPTDRFYFEGFLPAKAARRRKRLEALNRRGETLAFYETPNRVADSLKDMSEILGASRPATLCRELTKLHETVWTDTLQALQERVVESPDQQRGEFVILVTGAQALDQDATRLEEGKRLFELLRSDMAPGKAARIAAEFTGCRRNALYS